MEKRDSKNAIGNMSMPAGFPYRSVFLHGRPQHEKYDDFWRRHPPMDVTHRAKIFAPFDALAGFSEAIAGKQVLYQDRRSLSEGEKWELDRKVSVLHSLTYNGKAVRRNQPEVTIQYFLPCQDPNSSAYGIQGTYETVTGICRQVNTVSRTITVGYTVLAMDDIVDISGKLFEDLEDETP